MKHVVEGLTSNEEETRAFGRRLAEQVGPGALISLEGDLGAGKTVLVRGLAEGIGIDPDAISSPSFVLAIEHRGPESSLLHVDLYRLPENSGIDDLGVEEALDEGWIVAIEWGQRLPRLLRDGAWRVHFGPGETPTTRHITALPPRRV